MDTLSVNQKVLIAGLIGFLIGFGSVLVWNVTQTGLMLEDIPESKEAAQEEGRNGEEAEPSTAPILIGEQDRVDVDDQMAGSFVRITTVEFERPGWVAIHEDRDGVLGNVLGAQLFPAGTSRGEVGLLRDTVPGATYHAVLYNDNGNRAFELTIDAQIVDESQQPVIDTFQTFPTSG